jgi:uncharacterized RDD family membrane protein YckC
MTEEHFGGFWRRAAAYGIDKTILQVFYIILFVAGLLIQGVDQPIRHWMELDLYESLVGSGVIWIYYLMALFLDMIYFTWFHGSIGQTPGKMLMRLRVVQATGGPMTFGLAFLRWVGYLISTLAAYLGFIWIAFDRRKQGWHDKIAGTLVVTGKKGLDKESYII